MSPLERWDPETGRLIERRSHPLTPWASASAAIMVLSVAYFGGQFAVISGGAASGGWLPDEAAAAPAAPTFDAVVFAATGDSARVVLGAFSGDGGDPHDSTQIQADTTGGDFTSPQYHNVSLGAVRTDTVLADSGAVIDIRARVKGDEGGWSVWDTLSGVAMTMDGATEPVFDVGTDDLLEQMDFDTIDGFASGTNQLIDRWPEGVANWQGRAAADDDFQHVSDPGSEADSDSIINVGAWGRSGNGLRMLYGVNGCTDCLVGPRNDANFGSIGATDGNLPEAAGPYTHLYATVWVKVDAGGDPSDGDRDGTKGFMFYNPDMSDRIEVKPAARRNFAGGLYCDPVGVQDPGPFVVYDGGWAWNEMFDTAFVSDSVNYTLNTTDPPGCEVHWSNFNDGNWHRWTFEFVSGTTAALRGSRLWINGVLYFDNVGKVMAVVDLFGQGVGKWYDGTDITTNNCGVLECGGMREPFAESRYGMQVWGNFANGLADASSDFYVYFDDWTMWVEN